MEMIVQLLISNDDSDDDSNNDSDDEIYRNLQNYLLNKIIKNSKIIMILTYQYFLMITLKVKCSNIIIYLCIREHHKI